MSGPGFILHYDMEVSHFAAATTGHLVLLGLDSLRFSDDVFNTPSSGVPVIEWARASAARRRRHGPRTLLAGRRLVPGSAGGLLRALGGRRERHAGPAGLPLHGAGAGWAGARGRGHVPPVEGGAERRLSRGHRRGQRLGVPHAGVRRRHATDGRDRRRSLDLRELAQGDQGRTDRGRQRRREPPQPARRRASARRRGSSVGLPGRDRHARDRGILTGRRRGARQRRGRPARAGRRWLSGGPGSGARSRRARGSRHAAPAC